MRFIDHTQRHHTRQDASARVVDVTQRPLPDNAHHSQKTHIHAPGRIRIRNTSKRAAVEPRLRPHDHWHRHIFPVHLKFVLGHYLKLLHRSHTCDYWLTSNTSVIHKHVSGLSIPNFTCQPQLYTNNSHQTVARSSSCFLHPKQIASKIAFSPHILFLYVILTPMYVALVSRQLSQVDSIAMPLQVTVKNYKVRCQCDVAFTVRFVLISPLRQKLT